MSTIKEEYKLSRKDNHWVTEVLGKNYGFRKWTWGEKNQASVESTNVDQITGIVNFNMAIFNLRLVKSTVFKEENGKFVEFSEDEIKNLDGQLGERLFQITQKLNLVGRIESINL